jgi:aldehyde dehydrogenase (NAD(P)+)
MLPTTTSEIDRTLETLTAAAPGWLAAGIEERIALLDEVRGLVAANAEEWVHASLQGKLVDPNSPLAGEEWISGPYPVLTWIDEAQQTLRAIDAGTDPLDGMRVRVTPEGRLAVRVYPTNPIERLLLHGYEVETWMADDVTVDSVADTIGRAYREPPPPRVGLVLGAGNITSIPALDLLYKMFAELQVVVVKLNPVNEYLGPVFERVFAPLVEAGYAALVYGDGQVGQYLTRHELVDAIHITGSARTHDQIVFGPGPEGDARRARNEPVLTKPITSELGGVSPTIVVPGEWTDADIRFQAEQIASQKLHNGGYNCVAAQVLVLPEGWDRAQDLLHEVAAVMHRVEERMPWYPGSAERQRAAVDAAEEAERHEGTTHLGDDTRHTIIRGVDPNHDHHCFTTESFAPVLATTTLPAPSLRGFLESAVAFANQRLHGTLGANLIVDPQTERVLGADLERAIEELRYGSIGVNTWTGVAYLVTRAAWGAAPGHTLDDIQSGIGMVHNSMLFDRAVKTVARAPFRPFPRGLRHGSAALSPRPPWFVTNRMADVTTRRLTAWAADHKLWRLPGIVVSAMRG